MDNENEHKEEAEAVAKLLELTVPDAAAYIISYAKPVEGEENHFDVSSMLNGNMDVLKHMISVMGDDILTEQFGIKAPKDPVRRVSWLLNILSKQLEGDE